MNRMFFALAGAFVFTSSALFAQQAPYDAKTIQNKIQVLNAPAVERNAAKIKAEIAKLRADTRFGKEALYTFDLIEAGLAANGKADKAKIPAAPKELTPDQREAAFFAASKVFMNMRDYPMAQLLGAVAPKPVPVYVCDVVEKAPSDVGEWLSSPILKNQKKRATEFEKYNEKAAALLINDVNSVRDTATLKTDRNCPVSFFMQADKYGISVFVEAKDDKTDEVMAGLEYGGMYEMYLQPGRGEFYYQWLYYVNPEKCDFVDWMTNGRRYRPLSEYLQYSTKQIPGGLGTYFFIPWNALYDRLPDAKSEWAFGVIPWVRAGGFTWGSGQVHELNKFGVVKFNGIEKMLPSIKKQIVLSAWGKYKRESGDIRTFWNDEQRGDRAFETGVVAPLMDKLAEYGKSVNASMDAATVDKLFREAVPAWNEFGYVVDGLRADYLKEKMTAE